MTPIRSTTYALRVPFAPRVFVVSALALALAHALPLGAQRADGVRPDATPLTLATAQALGLRVSPAVVVAREAATAAAARARQAAAFPNPTLTYDAERTSAGTARNSQGIVALEQPFEPGLRAARSRAASLRSEAAEALRRDAEAAVMHDVARAFARVLEMDRRVELAARADSAFDAARRVSDARFAAGDISGYAQGRVRLEAARYRALRAEALLERRRARLAFATLLTVDGTPLDPEAFRLDTSTDGARPAPATEAVDSLVALALSARPDLAAARLGAEAADAEVRLAERSRIPTASLTAGMKREESAGLGTMRGLVFGLSLPLPLWDRRAAAADAARADARGSAATVHQLERIIELEVRDAHAALITIERQLAALTPDLGESASATVRAAEAAYVEGEIPLIEWLDAVRAHQETEAALAALRAESIIRRSALDRAVGSLSRRSTP